MNNQTLSVKQVAEQQLIPWATDRHTIMKLIKARKIQYFMITGPKQNRYLIKTKWIKSYVRRQQKITAR